jgi:hypothetical protein
MDGAGLVSAVRTDVTTELDRLGSEKALIATTDATLEREAVLRAAAAAERRAADTFETWAAEADHEAARDAFAELVETEAAHWETVAGLLEGEPKADVGADALDEYLRDLEGTPERVGAGLVGRPLASERTLLQVINFFVNEADRTTADRFRKLRSETQSLTERGAEVLDAVCASEDEWDRARSAAEEAIQVVYEEYASTLEGMGVDPRPVC